MIFIKNLSREYEKYKILVLKIWEFFSIFESDWTVWLPIKPFSYAVYVNLLATALYHFIFAFRNDITASRAYFWGSFMLSDFEILLTDLFLNIEVACKFPVIFSEPKNIFYFQCFLKFFKSFHIFILSKANVSKILFFSLVCLFLGAFFAEVWATA